MSHTRRLLSLSTAILVASTAIAAAEPSAELIEAAKKEGMLTTIALPASWCNYGESIDTFKERTGLEVNELNPDAGSADALTAIEANKDNPGPQAPDVVDVGLSFGPEAASGCHDDLVARLRAAKRPAADGAARREASHG